ncbi:hypothetical protein GCM10010464_05110 [Pseudonocardia yunnanensis]
MVTTPARTATDPRKTVGHHGVWEPGDGTLDTPRSIAENARRSRAYQKNGRELDISAVSRREPSADVDLALARVVDHSRTSRGVIVP